ncbi:MAG: 5-formyltetrahydrofolate cyclo-ligase [Erysipelotrichaceae bacterium]|nr:5-formyltetrahydrofolate cyclo-ligase [Erysipelotrichaceae bacterium]
MENKEAIAFIESCPWFNESPGLENMRKLMNELNNPQDDLKFIHVAGTNGKGSACAYLSEILKEAGYKTGTFISPHLIDYKERFSINDEQISEKAFCETVEKVKEAINRLEVKPSLFEVVTAIAFLYFKEENCDLVVLEVGLGGRIDATNIVKENVVSLIMNIGLEHTNILGNTLEEIAREKAGIIKENSDVVVYDVPELREIYKEICDKTNSDLYLSDFSKLNVISEGINKQLFDYKEYKNIEISLLGHHQFLNAAVVLETIEVLSKKGYKISDENIYTGLKNTKWDARLSILSNSPLFIVDGAHNKQCAMALASSLPNILNGQKAIMLCGILKDKQYEDIIDLMSPFAKEFICITPDSPRALLNSELALLINKKGIKATCANDISEALKLSLELSDEKTPIMAFGSLYIAGEIEEKYPDILKKYLRKKIKNKRLSLCSDEVKDKSQKIINTLRKQEEYIKAKNILIYNSINNEVDLSELVSDDKCFAYPLCIEDKKMLALIPDNETCFNNGSYGIKEPDIKRSKEMKDIDLIICPLVAFDENNNRLGNGAGYYDRFLENKNIKTIGVAYDIQKIIEVPVNKYDVKLHKIITESKTYVK